MNIRQIQSVFSVDVWRALRVPLRYVFGRGAAQKIKPVRENGHRLPVVEADGCVGCKLCMKICPAHAIDVKTRLQDERSPVDFKLDTARCVACGLCLEACPDGALRFERKKADVRD